MAESRLRDDANGIILDGESEGASLAGIRKTDRGEYEIDCLQEESVPEIAFGHVFFDYNFAVRISNSSDEAREVKIRLLLCERSARRNMKFMSRMEGRRRACR